MSTEVPASIAGSLFQLERALLHLATQPPDSSVGVEKEDDVSVEGTQPSLFEQDKLSFQVGGSAISDRSHNLWNTLSIWCMKYQAEPWQQGKHQLWLVTNTHGRTSLARTLDEATTLEKAKKAVTELRRLGTSEDKDVQALMNKVLAQPEATLHEVILAFCLQDAASGQSTSELKARTITALRLPDGLDAEIVLMALKGWVESCLMTAWSTGKPGLISTQAFVNQLHAIIRNVKLELLREKPYGAVIARDDERNRARVQLFVTLLVDLGVNDDLIELAVESYIRFNTEYLRLLEEGSVVGNEWEHFFTSLIQRWSEIRGSELMDSETDDKLRLGRAILRRTAHSQHCGVLCGTPTVHSYFTTGSYHGLANEEKVGWHPEFVPPSRR